MNKKNGTSALTEAAMVSGLLVIFSMISFYVFPFLDFLFPVPGILLGKRRGFKYSALSLVSASLIVSFIIGFQMGFVYLFMYTPIAMAMSYMICKNKKPVSVIIAGSIVMLISLVVIVYCIQLFMGISLADELTSMIKESFDMTKDMLGSLTGLGIEDMGNFMNNMITTLTRIIPMMLMVTSVLMAVVNYMVAMIVSRRFKIEIKPLRDLAFFSLPKSFVLGILAMLVMSFALGKLSFPNSEVIAINIFMIGVFAFFVQGLGIVKFLCIRKSVRPVFRVLIFISAIIIPFVTSIVISLGVIDAALDFRNLRKLR